MLKGCGSIIGGILGIIGILFLLNDFGLFKPDQKEIEKQIGLNAAQMIQKDIDNKQKALKELVMTDIKIKDFHWHLGGFDSIMIADFTILNQSPNDVKDIEIKCTHYAKSGTIIDSNTKVIYDIIKAGRQKKFRKVNMGFIRSQADTSSAKITDLVVIH